MITTKRTPRAFMPRACLKCGGDAFFDDGEAAEWRCLQCGRSTSPATIEQRTEQLELAIENARIPRRKSRSGY
jgi:hypothetical protein